MKLTKKEKAAFVQEQLEFYFPEPEVPLQHRDHFSLLVAVMLSAQTTDAMVNRVTPALFEMADTPAKMAALSVEDIRSVISPVGLAPTKAKHLQALSEAIVKNFDGRVPNNLEDLESLPGVGHKTASVVLCQAFGIPAFPVDTHIHRLAWRWGLSNGKRVEQTEKDLKKLFPESSWIKLHLQIIYFGRKFCPAKGHDAVSCPICSKIGRKELFIQNRLRPKSKA